MNTVELISGFTVQIPNREFELLKKMVKSKKELFKRNSLSPRAPTLADNLVQHHVLDRNDDYYKIRQFTIIKD